MAAAAMTAMAEQKQVSTGNGEEFDEGIFSQICLTNDTKCDKWEPNPFKKQNCKCGARFLAHSKAAVQPSDVYAYLAHIEALSPCNEILPADAAAGQGALYLGSKAACGNKVVEKLNIGAIAQTAGGLEAFFPPFGKQIENLRSKNVAILQLGWTDSESFKLSPNHLQEGIDFLNEHRAKGVNCVVNCAQGKSRSSTLVIAYLMWLDRVRFSSVKETLKFVHARRSLAEPNRNFMKQLEEFASQLS